MTELHNHLRLHQGSTAASLWADLERLRRLGIAYDDLPATWQAFHEGLQAMAIAGLAEKSGEIWLWRPAKAKEERTLFA